MTHGRWLKSSPRNHVKAPEDKASGAFSFSGRDGPSLHQAKSILAQQSSLKDTYLTRPLEASG